MAFFFDGQIVYVSVSVDRWGVETVLLLSILGKVPTATRAALLLTVGISVFGLTDNFIYQVSDDIGIGQFHFSRSLIASLLVLLMSKFFVLTVIPQKWGAVLFRTFFIMLSMLLYFAVVPMMPIAVAGAGLFTSPIFVLLFSAALFRERVGPRRILAVAIGTAGVLLVLQPQGESFTLYHILPVLAGACYALGSIVTYRYCQEESPLALLLAFLVAIGLAGGGYATLMSGWPVSNALLSDAPFIFRGWKSVGLEFWGWMGLIGLGASISLALMFRAYQLAQTSYLVIFEYAYLLSAGFFSWLFWGIVPNGIATVGIVLIVLAGVVIVWGQMKEEPATAPIR